MFDDPELRTVSSPRDQSYLENPISHGSQDISKEIDPDEVYLSDVKTQRIFTEEPLPAELPAKKIPKKTERYKLQRRKSFPEKWSSKRAAHSKNKKYFLDDRMTRTFGNSIGKAVYNLGEKGSGIKTRGDVQDFKQLRQQCLESGQLFEDPEFPADDSSLFYSERPDKCIEWKRPMEIADSPQLFVKGFSRFDVQQGELGDCWLLAAVANLTLYPNVFTNIVPEDQSFNDEDYAGIFHFRFWQYGRWVDVVIDDRLPTYDGELVYLHSAESREFWSALLEKAYAKLHGSYEALKGGTTSEAMEDFTGGVTEIYKMEETPPNLFSILLKAYERNSLMSCSIDPDPNVLEAETPQGLIMGHAYSITGVKHFDIATPNRVGKIPLLRLRNPWGNEAEWKGPWSDESPEWQFIADHEKDELGLTFDIDGEFWMSLRNVKTYFTHLEICNLNPDSLTEGDLNAGKKKWEMSVFENEWVRGVTAGGNPNSSEYFWHNPQYRITLECADEGDDECTVIVALMQKNRRAQKRNGIELLSIGFVVYHLDYPAKLPKPLGIKFFKSNKPVVGSPSFINMREVSCRFKLPPGTYCIVPSTFYPNEEGEFLLRIFSENKNNMEENDDKVGIGEVDNRIHDQLERQDNEEKIGKLFRTLAGKDMEVDWMELKNILDYSMQDESHNQGFSADICRSMVAMIDVDHSGRLGYNEFRTLWKNVKTWREVFKLYDKDDSGHLSAFELRQALNSAGYRLNNHILNMLVHRYGTKDGFIMFGDYIMCTLRLETMIEIFRERDPDNTNAATFTMEDWVEKTLYS